MSKPELEKGFTRLANELMEALCRTNLAKYESRILWTVLRKTYGYQKKMDEISLSQFSKATGINKPNVHRTLKLLIRRRIIVSEPQVPGKIFYGLQTDYDQWMGSSLSKPIVSGETLSDATLSEEIRSNVAIDNETLSAETNTKERKTKERVIETKSSVRRTTSTANKEFFMWWGAQYQQKFGEPYVFNFGKEAKLIKGLLSNYELSRIKELGLRFFESKDPWIQQKGGYTIGIFTSQINKLVSTDRCNSTRLVRSEMPL
jgi:phage replication O-like protein O